MVIDTSALVAILLDEPDARRYAAAIDAARTRLISAASVLETAIVLERRSGAQSAANLDRVIQRAGIQVAAVTPSQVEIAREGFRRFGKGRHPASLNFGDCFSYALARSEGEPLLFKGDDFSKTDVVAVL
jgi:ribonuclease VapC